MQLQLVGKKQVCVASACIHGFRFVAGTLCHNDACSHCKTPLLWMCHMMLGQVDYACADGSEFGPTGITAFVLL